MAEIITISFRKKPTAQEPQEVSIKDFVDGNRLHLARFAISKGIALHEVDRFARYIELVVRDDKEMTPRVMAEMLRQDSCYAVLEERFMAFLGFWP